MPAEKTVIAKDPDLCGEVAQGDTYLTFQASMLHSEFIGFQERL